jgi:antitoxin ParD1/3/4
MANEPLTLTIPARFARAFRDAVAAGEYASPEAALADALENWTHRHEDAEEELAWMKARIQASLADPRPSLTMAEVRSYLDQVFERTRAADDAAA